MGRYPFLSRLEVFLKDMRPFYESVSHGNLSRKLHQIHDILQLLKKNGYEISTNPEMISEREIGALLEYMSGKTELRNGRMAPSTQTCLLGALSVFLESEGNAVIARMRAKRLIRTGSGSSGPLPCPSIDEVQRVVSRLSELANDGDTRALGILGLVLFGAYSGLRPKEVRFADMSDFYQSEWILVVRHPKGEGTWGKVRNVKMVSPGRDAIAHFLMIRERELARMGIENLGSNPLVPCFRSDGSISRWSSTYALQIKGKYEQSLGLRFGFQMMRRSFGQCAINMNARIDSISVLMGHKTTRTTELYYARRREQDAINDLEEAWSTSKSQSLLIED